MKAPEKIYLFENPIDNTPDYRWLSSRSRDNDVEYTRTDAFIEKAIDYIVNNMRCDGYTMQTKATFIKGFKNYMKGESSMTQIQLIDLCSRVPYHPKGHVVNACNGAECDEWLTCATFPMFTRITNNSRLYLRPMSGMTEEEINELKKLSSGVVWRKDVLHNIVLDIWYNTDSIDWLNAHHFDYRNLIERGLAIEVTEENNPYL